MVDSMRTFRMIRQFDETGVSGTGEVLEGVIFTDGACVVRWKTDIACQSDWRSFDDFLKIHVFAHPDNKTIIQFNDGEERKFPEG